MLSRARSEKHFLALALSCQDVPCLNTSNPVPRLAYSIFGALPPRPHLIFPAITQAEAVSPAAEVLGIAPSSAAAKRVPKFEVERESTGADPAWTPSSSSRLQSKREILATPSMIREQKKALSLKCRV